MSLIYKALKYRKIDASWHLYIRHKARLRQILPVFLICGSHYIKSIYDTGLFERFFRRRKGSSKARYRERGGHGWVSSYICWLSFLCWCFKFSLPSLLVLISARVMSKKPPQHRIIRLYYEMLVVHILESGHNSAY